MRRFGLAVVVIALSGCASPRSDDGDSASGGLDRGLAAEATEQTDANGASTTSAPASPGGDPAGGTSDGGTGSVGTGGVSGGSGGSAARRLAVQPDATGDAGVRAPGYADLVEIELVDTGSALRTTILVGGAIPRVLEDRHTAGIGLDLYIRDDAAESDYQVFLEGSSDGWFAYLETPEGLAQFVGTFELAVDRYVVTVPWSALGDHRTGRFAVFADASSALVAVAVSSEDHAPEESRARFG